MERLQKVLARAGVASRRACEQLIRAGRVTVNGLTVTELGTKVRPDVDILAVDGRPVSVSTPPVYVMLNKPPGYVSTTSDPYGRPTVLDLLPEYTDARLYPVGRLDTDSEGLLLLTNDGSLTERLTHPRYGLEKEYLVWVEGEPTAGCLERLRSGVPLDGKLAGVDTVAVVEAGISANQTSLLRIILHEGRKREIRRLCAAIGHPVRRLQRVRLGPLHLGQLAPGASRLLTKQETAQLMALSTSVQRPAAGPAPGASETPTGLRRTHANQARNSIHDHHRRPRRSR